jgi:hypothetical protein
MLMLFWPVISKMLQRIRRGNNDLDEARPVE